MGEILDDIPSALEEVSEFKISKALHVVNLHQSNNLFHQHPSHVKHKLEDYKEYQPYMVWKPLEVIKKTFENTTQFVSAEFEPPMRRHFKSRFPSLNRPRLRETFATDTWFGSQPAYGGFT